MFKRILFRFLSIFKTESKPTKPLRTKKSPNILRIVMTDFSRQSPVTMDKLPVAHLYEDTSKKQTEDILTKILNEVAAKSAVTMKDIDKLLKQGKKVK